MQEEHREPRPTHVLIVLDLLQGLDLPQGLVGDAILQAPQGHLLERHDLSSLRDTTLTLPPIPGWGRACASGQVSCGGSQRPKALGGVGSAPTPFWREIRSSLGPSCCGAARTAPRL